MFEETLCYLWIKCNQMGHEADIYKSKKNQQQEKEAKVVD